MTKVSVVVVHVAVLGVVVVGVAVVGVVVVGVAAFSSNGHLFNEYISEWSGCVPMVLSHSGNECGVLEATYHCWWVEPPSGHVH